MTTTSYIPNIMTVYASNAPKMRSTGAGINQDETITPPSREFPMPEEEEGINPNREIPEEEEYLPDEEEITIEEPDIEIDDPIYPDREEDFPPDDEPELPPTDPR